MPHTPIPFDMIMDDLVRQGWCVVPAFMSPQTIAQLAQETQLLKQTLNPASTGNGQKRAINNLVRGDSIMWLEEPDLTKTQRDYLGTLEKLRLAINEGLQLGLFEFEGHLAVYPPGSFYRKHLDRFQSDSLRALTVILYLNENWQAAEGGQLRIYTGGDASLDVLHQGGSYFDVLPRGGTLVAFLSDRFWHEVLPASRERLSITGWFKTCNRAMV